MERTITSKYTIVKIININAYILKDTEGRNYLASWIEWEGDDPGDEYAAYQLPADQDIDKLNEQSIKGFMTNPQNNPCIIIRESDFMI